MTSKTLLCRNCTPFAKDGSLDENAFRAFLQRFVDSGLGVYMASGGSGEGHALSHDEVRRVYEIGVEVCKGKVQANANLPEQHTPQATIEHAMIAAKAKVDVINIYGPTSWHGFRPTADELAAYLDAVLGAVKHPIALAPNPVIGYTPKASVVADYCNRYQQVVAVNLAGLGDGYFIELKDNLKRDIEIYVPFMSSAHTLGLGATGLLGAEANIIPKTFRMYLDGYASGDVAGMNDAYAKLFRFKQYVLPWQSSTPRWQKMAMKVLGIPGGEGGLRLPYKMPADDEVKKFADGLLKLGIPEVNELAKSSSYFAAA